MRRASSYSYPRGILSFETGGFELKSMNANKRDVHLEILYTNRD